MPTTHKNLPICHFVIWFSVLVELPSQRELGRIGDPPKLFDSHNSNRLKTVLRVYFAGVAA